ncbi:MAG: oxidoreductase [Clostridia bacterium]|nr:oxidoreductase [Clostridia bacterium]
MKQTSGILSTYSADVFGVCSALFELGGMTVMHDASGCNSTYTTHDEPRWMDMDSMVYISALSEMEAIMGDDSKLISDIVTAAEELHPKFITIAGTPIPAMTGFDYEACAAMIEAQTGIPALGIATTGMNSYIHGASMAYLAFAKRFVCRNAPKTASPSVNILGMTPLDFSVTGESDAVVRFCRNAGFAVNANFSMGCTFDELVNSAAAHVNLVVSSAGLALAQWMEEELGIPYVIGTPVAGAYAGILADALRDACDTKQSRLCARHTGESGDIVIIGENVRSAALAEALTELTGRRCRVVSSVSETPLREGDVYAPWEDDVTEAVQNAGVVIADPLFRPVVPANAAFIPSPHEACSGRIWRDDIINPADSIETILAQL